MIIMVVWSLLNVWTYTQDLGMTTAMRNDISNTMLNTEKIRSLLSQERTYALDRALLLAGTATNPGCESLETWNTFPEIPTANLDQSLYEVAIDPQCPTDYSISSGGCCPNTYTYNPINDNCMSQKDPLPSYDGTFSCKIEYEYSLDIGLCCKIGDQDCTDNMEPTITACASGYYITNNVCCLTDHVYDTLFRKCVDEIDTVTPTCPDNYFETNNYCCKQGFAYEPSNNVCVDLSGNKIYYWKYDDNICIPTWEELGDNVDAYLTDVFGHLKLDSYNIERASIVSEEAYTMQKIGIYWETTFSQRFLEYDYIVRLMDDYSIDIFNKTNMLKVVASSVGAIVVLEDRRFVLEGPKSYDVSLSVRSTGKTYKCEQIKNSKYLFESIYDKDSGLYNYYATEANATCYPIGVSVPLILEQEVTLDEYIFRVDIMDDLAGGFISLREYNPMDFIISKEEMYYIPQRKEWVYVDKKIGDQNPAKGKIVYDFIPSSNDKVCFEIKTATYNITNCLSLYSRNMYLGEFPDLYAYASSFVEDTFEGVPGWMEYKIRDSLDKKDDVVDMKSLKVITPGKVEAKNDWKIELINHFGIVGTQFFDDSCDGPDCPVWDEFTEDFCYFHPDFLPEKEVLICRCDNDGNDCTEIMDQSIIAEFKRIIEDSKYYLYALTGYPWTIKIKNLKISVDNMCDSDPAFETEYTYQNDFDETTESQVVGIPMQILFGEKSDTQISGDMAWCENNAASGKLTEPCKVHTTTVSVCEEELECSLSGYCCKEGYEDNIEDNSGNKHRCCRLIKIDPCQRLDAIGNNTNTCVDTSGTEYNVSVTYNCPLILFESQ